VTFDAKMLLQAAQQVAGGQQYPKGTLYLVPTPIGNLADMSLRAVQVLSLVDRLACEDTRVTGGLLRLLGLECRMLALHEHNEAEAAQTVLQALSDGQRVACVSDAGTPAVSDPGARLVALAHQAGHRVLPLPGPSSVTTALSAAGDVSAQGFVFVGFLPSKGPGREAALAALPRPAHSTVLFEAPHRVGTLARELAQRIPDARLTLARELTKQFEDVVSLRAADWPAWLAADAHREKGEYAVVVHATTAQPADTGLTAPQEAVFRALAQHLPVKQAAGLMADLTGLPRKGLYDQALVWRQDRQDDGADDPEGH
jgi:16S rRNA (cytidine1402-2'-O)-methyltransferase